MFMELAGKYLVLACLVGLVLKMDVDKGTKMDSL